MSIPKVLKGIDTDIEEVDKQKEGYIEGKTALTKLTYQVQVMAIILAAYFFKG